MADNVKIYAVGHFKMLSYDDPKKHKFRHQNIVDLQEDDNPS